MNFKKILTAFIASAVSASMVLSGNIFSTAETSDTIKIMSIGDSITDGYGTDGSYRKFLYKGLTDSGYAIDMVGPNWSWGDATYTDSETGESFSYDAAHCGYSGYAIKEYSGRSGILETIQSGNYLSEYTPDIVILQIGTNDVIDNHEIDTAGERLEDLADYILQNISDDSALFITTIPNLDPNRSDVYSWFGNYRHSADWLTNYSDEEVVVNVQRSIDNYNAQVKALVEEKQSSGVSNIYFGNVNSAVTDVTTQLKDGVHPNDVGYKLMGEYWLTQIKSYLSGETVIPTEPTEPSTEPTEPTEQPTETTTSVVTDPVETTMTTAVSEPDESETTTNVLTEPDEFETTTNVLTEPDESETTTTTVVTEPDESETTETGDVTSATETTIPTETSTEVTTSEVIETTEPVITIIGDVNEDEAVNVADAVALSMFLAGNKNEAVNKDLCDINSDNKVNVFDFIALKQLIMKMR